MDESEHDGSHELKLMNADGYETATSDNPKKHAAREENMVTDCLHHVGYLKKRPKDESVPDSCLTCPKILQCMV
jgi:hypothetical protein